MMASVSVPYPIVAAPITYANTSGANVGDLGTTPDFQVCQLRWDDWIESWNAKNRKLLGVDVWGAIDGLFIYWSTIARRNNSIITSATKPTTNATVATAATTIANEFFTFSATQPVFVYDGYRTSTNASGHVYSSRYVLFKNYELLSLCIYAFIARFL